MEPTKLRTKGAGTVSLKNGHWHVRVSLPDGTRPWYTLCKAKLTGECTCMAMSEARRAEVAAHIAERERERVAKELAEENRLVRERRLTVKAFGEKWTSGQLYEKHGDVNGLKLKASAKNDEYRLKAYVYPEIGNMPVADVTEQDVEIVLQKAEVKARKKLGRS